MTTEYDAFAETYECEYGLTSFDIDFYLEEARAAQPPVLELACGTGRVTLPIARAGVPVVGVDSSVEMLARARQKSAGEDLPLRWVQADMREFELGERFGLAIVPARSFLHLLDPGDHVQALETIHAHLRPGGRLALNFFVPSVRILAEHTASTAQMLKFSREFVHPESGGRVVAWESRHIDLHRQRIHVRFRYEELDSQERVQSIRHRAYTLCYIWPREMEHLLARCGFEIEATYGWFDRRPFDADSAEQIWVARRPA
ncbi:MAG: class I SAM-dependent methyltransferase [Anaerolineae bacterium]|jgi:SAM-dependent methyltransferase